jgi:hypothetical protein
VEVATVVKISCRRVFFFCVVSVLLLLNASQGVASEKARANLPALGLEIWESQHLTLPSGYTVTRVQGTRKPTADDRLKPSSPSRKTTPPSSRNLRTQPKRTPLQSTRPQQPEKIRVTPSTLNLTVGEKQKLTLSGKKLRDAKSAVVYLQKTQKREFLTKLNCNSAGSCALELTLKQKLAPGSFNVQLFNAQRKLIATGGFKVSKVLGLTELVGITLSVREAASGETVKGTIILTGKAPAPNGVKIALSSSDGQMAKVSPLQIRAGQSQGSFSLKTGSKPGSVAITAKLGRVSRVAKLSVSAPVALAKFTLDKQKATPGGTVKGTVTLTGKAPAPSGVKVAMSSSDGQMAKVPPLQIRAGQSQGSFSFKTGSKPGSVAITAKLGRVSRVAKLSVSAPAALAKFTLDKQKAAPGETVKGTIILTGKAPAPSGVKVAMSSSDGQMAKVSPVQIRAGQSQGSFSFKAGSKPGNVKITAKLSNSTLITSLAVSAPVALAKFTLDKQKAAPGETVKGTIILTDKAPAPNGVKVALSSSDGQMAKVSPLQIRAGQSQGSFSFKAGSKPGNVKITAKLSNSTLITSLAVIAIPFTPITANQGTFQMTGRRPAPFTPITANKGMFQMTGRRQAPFTPITANQGTFQMTGRRPAPFTPITANQGTFQMTGRRPASFTPITANQGTFQMTGRRPASFTPITANQGTFQMTGRRGESVQSPVAPPVGPTPFTPVVIDPGTFQVTGRRPAPFTPVVIDPGTFQVTGRRPAPFTPVVIDPGTFQVTGRRGGSAQSQDAVPFTPVIVNPGKLQATGRRPIPFTPVIVNPGKLQATGRRPIPFTPVIVNPGKLQATGRRPIPFTPVIVNPGKLQAVGRRGEPEESAETPTGGSAQDTVNDLLNPDLGILPGLLGGGAESGGSTPEEPPVESPPATPPAESTSERVFSFDPGTFQMTGREKPEEPTAEIPPTGSIVDNLFTFDPGTFKMTGRRGMAD